MVVWTRMVTVEIGKTGCAFKMYFRGAIDRMHCMPGIGLGGPEAAMENNINNIPALVEVILQRRRKTINNYTHLKCI